MKRSRTPKEKEGKKSLNYEGLELPENLNYILDQDFWMLDKVGGTMLAMLRQPMKFTSFTSIFVRRGRCRAEINLQEYEIEAPCVVNIGSSEILQPIDISDDFDGAFMVMSGRMLNDIKKAVGDPALLAKFNENPVLSVQPQYATNFELFIGHLRSASSDTANEYIYEAVFHTIMSFFYHTALRCMQTQHGHGSTAAHITSRFLKLARENFKKERFMDFYATALEITPKHLSRTIKAQTGYTASEWLDRLVILEAKVLLKSTSMTVQQIAEELNFTSQSFFGKYFKNLVGVSPKDFRNG